MSAYSQDCFPAENLPTPRLELAWKHVKGDEYLCEYALVLRLGEYDIRRERGDEKVWEIRAPLSGGTKVTRGSPPDKHGRIDTPFRDHSHARWDSSQLSGLPIFSTYNGRASRIVVETQQDKTEKS